MSGWTQVEIGKVKIEHLSTASIIKMTITDFKPVSVNKSELVSNKVFFTYETFQQLKNALNKIEDLFP